MSHVFISHASEDADMAGAVHDALEGGGCACWMARTDVEPGADFAESITEAITAARVVVVLLSAKSMGSRHVRREVELADREEKAILLVRIEDEPLVAWVKYHSAANQWLDVFGEKGAVKARRVADAVNKLIGGAGRAGASGAAGHAGGSEKKDGASDVGPGNKAARGREVVVVVPELGESVHEAILVKWFVRIGQSVNEKQPLAEVETDKAIVEVPSPHAGVVVNLHATVEKVVHVGRPLLTLALPA